MNKQARFLPPSRSTADKFNLNQQLGFAAYERSFLKNVSDLMAGVQDSSSEPRAPSPFGRVWQFRRSLAGELGDNRKNEAVSTFRGILALIALRDYFHLPVQFGISPPLGGERTKLAQLFESHLSCVPASNGAGAQCAPFLWLNRLPYLYLRLDNGEEVTFAGYSPLSLVYPAAKKLPAGLEQQIFWWDTSKGRLTDPTTLPLGHAASTLCQEVRPWIRKWLETMASDQILAELHLATKDFQLLQELLTNWKSELDQVFPAALDLVAEEMKGNQSYEDAKLLPGMPSIPKFFNHAIPARTDFTDIPRKTSRLTNQETLIISLDHVGQPTTKIYGTVRGSAAIKDKLRHAPAEGSNLGTVLGISAPMPYVVIDSLFEETLPVVYQGQNAPKISRGWHALTLDNKAYLYPFKSTLLTYFSTEEIVANTKIEGAVTGVCVTLVWSSARAFRTYTGINSCPLLDSSMDLRLFPDFAIDSVPDVFSLLPQETDRRYYARLRQFHAATYNNPQWLNSVGAPVPLQQWEEGQFDQSGGLSPGKQFFWQIDKAEESKNRPSVFSLTDSGMLFANLKQCPANSTQTCEIGLDFGTSNTCVFIKKEHDTQPKELVLPVFTTSLLDYWDVDLGRGNAAEGCSALFDFPYQNKNYPQDQQAAVESLGLSVNRLNPKVFFPTQVVHHNYGATPGPTDPFSLRNGLAFFQNITVSSLGAARISDLIEGFDHLTSVQENLPKRFILRRDLKWDDDLDTSKMPNTAWRNVFHRHLRLQIVMTAAQMGAKVTHLKASYPKAFSSTKTEGYKNLLQAVWGNGVEITQMSESAAAAADLNFDNAQWAYLIDIGGGTADFAIYRDKHLISEASFRMAGSFLEEYFSAAKVFRTTLADYLKSNPVLNAPPVNKARLKDFEKSLHLAPQGNDLLLRNAYQGLISVSDPRIVIGDSIKGAKRSCAGFILSNIVLYGGLSYVAGLIHKTLNNNATQYQLGLHWVGNGSCFVSALSVGGTKDGFEKALAAIFRLASDWPGEVLCNALSKPKTIVASGLLKKPVAIGDSARNTASQVFSNSLFYEENERNPAQVESEMKVAGKFVKGVDDKGSLSDFYKQQSLDKFEWDGLREGIFKHFLESLQTAIKSLKMGDVNYGGSVLGFSDTANWAIEYVTKRKEFIATKFKRRMIGNYRDWNNIAQTDPGNLQVEPLFITEVCALLEDIRENYGEASE